MIILMSIKAKKSLLGLCLLDIFNIDFSPCGSYSIDF